MVGSQSQHSQAALTIVAAIMTITPTTTDCNSSCPSIATLAVDDSHGWAIYPPSAASGRDRVRTGTASNLAFTSRRDGHRTADLRARQAIPRRPNESCPAGVGVLFSADAAVRFRGHGHRAEDR
jgi:hypothetical protein